MTYLQEVLEQEEAATVYGSAQEEPARLVDMSLELWRQGTFRVDNPVDLLNRCGITGQGLTYRYEIRMSCRADVLDERGFALDNRILNLYWINKYQNDDPKPLPSCERMAQEAIQDFRQLCELCGVEILGLEVRIYGGSHSAVTVRWPKTFSLSHATSAPGEPLPEPVAEWVEEESRTLQHMRRLLGKTRIAGLLTAGA